MSQRLRMVVLAVSVGAMSACGDVNAALEKASEARQLGADLVVQFTKAADAANRAVMADTDEASVSFAKEAEQTKAAVQKDAGALGPLLQELKYTDEEKLLTEFTGRFKEYQTLDQRILDLAVENTNLKAQRLSFGAAQDAADAFRDALKAVKPAGAANEYHVQALVATSVETVREIQVLQAPHIANADEAVMTKMEKDMATSEMNARNALGMLRPLVEPASRPRLATAAAALDKFKELNTQIITLSRRNTNVRSLALSLDQKRTSIAACEESLHALQDALNKRGHVGSR